VISFLTTLGLGLLLGFVLQRGSFCGSSLLSAFVLTGDLRGLVATGMAVAVSMCGFAVLAALGLVIADPNPMRLLSAVVGGLTFGVGMVLAGGCVSGTLFKAAEGRLPSMLALVGIGVGTTATDEGLLAPVKRGLVTATRAIHVPPGLHDLLGVSYPWAAGTIAVVSLFGVTMAHVRLSRRAGRAICPSLHQLAAGPWPAAIAGAAVGVLGWLAFLSSAANGRNYPIGVTGGVQGAFSWLVRGEGPENSWSTILVAGILLGSATSALMQRAWKLRSADPLTLLVALAGGLLVGFGVSVGRGCFIGNMVGGVALLSLHSALFAVLAVAANWVTTLFYLRGLR
jgi:uncharacterized protein